MSSLLQAALADLTEHPDSSAAAIAKRIGSDSRAVYGVLHNAAFKGLCQSWRPGGGPWLWELPGCTACQDKA